MPTHPVSDPQRWLLAVLHRERVRFLVIGGYAVRIHGVARQTRDLDLWVDCSKQNAEKIARGFHRIRAPLPKDGDWVAAFTKTNALYVYPAPSPEKGADILTSIAGMDFDACYSRSVQAELGKCQVCVIGLDDPITSKTPSVVSGNDEAAHNRDNADIDALSSLLKSRKRPFWNHRQCLIPPR